MGAVYLAWQKSLKREVAIKVLPPSVEDNDMSYGERFKAEAQVMARLNHPGIIAVYDAGETPSGLLYFVMEYVQGTDVHQMIASAGRLPPEHVHAIAAHVCEALAYAHANGLIHRDIKPANIMVDTQGRVKVADFGLAKMAQEDTGFTKSNMAPEALITGMPVDHRADLYAMGVMIYQMLTGKIPRGAWLPASVEAPGTDRRFDDIIVKAMQYDRDSRHSSAVELRAHLDSLLMPMVPAPNLQHYSSAGMAKQSAPPQSRPGVATARPAAASAPPGAGRAKATPSPQLASAPKSKTPLFIGLAAAAAIGIGAFVMLSGGEKEKGRAAGPPAAASVATAPKPAPTPPPAKTSEPAKPESKPTVAKVPEFPPGKWVKIDQTALLSKSGVGSGGWRNPTGPVTELTELNWKNQGIRFKTRFTGATTGDAHFLELRRQKSPDGDLSSYQLMLSVSQKSFSVRLDTEWSNNAQVIQPLSGHAMKPDTELAMELAIVGNQIISRIDGQLQPLLTDTTLGSGHLGFRNVFPVRDIEVINLDGLSEAEALKILGANEKGGDLPKPVLSIAASASLTSNLQSPVSPVFPPGQWVKIAITNEDLVGTGASITPSGNVKMGGRAFKLPSIVGTNLGVRARLKRPLDVAYSGITVRVKDVANRMLWLYDAGVKLRATDADRKIENSREFIDDLTRGGAAPVDIELAVVGTRTFGRFNQKLLPVHETPTSTHPGSVMLVCGSDEGEFSDIEVINLDGLPEAEALRILGVDEKGNDLRALAAKQEQQMSEQAKQTDAIAAIPELKALHDQLTQLTAERVTAPFETDLVKLNTGYLGGLDRKIAEEKQKGHLDGVLALEEEKKLITEKQPLPEDDDKTSETLKGLRKIYREAFTKLTTTRAANLKLLTDPLTTRLKQLESTLTQANRIDHAKTVREYREKLNQPKDGPPSVASNSVSAPATSTRSDSTPPKASKVKADPQKSRAAAEHALKLGAEVVVEDRGVKATVKTVEDLPKGNFALTAIYYGNQIRIVLADEDLASATQAAELEVFELRESNTCKFTSLTPFQNCPHLKRLVVCFYGALTAADCQVLGSLTELTSLSLPGGEPIADYNLLLGSKRCRELTIGHSGISV